MRKITANNILDIAQYERVRPQYRAEIFVHKQARRLEVGPFTSFLFETYETMLYQVQEMMRAERMVDDHLIAREIAVFNEMIPKKHQLSATLMIAILDPEQRDDFLSQALTLTEHLFLMIDSSPRNFTFDESQFSSTRLNSIQFVKCSLDEQDVELFCAPGSRNSIRFDHPLYAFEQEMPAALKAALANDLTRD